jgi:hypothetical protein
VRSVVKLPLFLGFGSITGDKKSGFCGAKCSETAGPWPGKHVHFEVEEMEQDPP